MTVDGCERRPHRKINMIGPLDVHRHAHCWSVCHEGMVAVISGYDDARADRLLAQKFPQNLILDSFCDVTAKEANHSQIHSRIHQSEGITSRDYTIKRWQILETSAHDLNLGMRAKLPAKDIAELFAAIYENQSHGGW